METLPNVPLPLVVQVEEVALPLKLDPVVVYAVPAQMVAIGGPALAPAGRLMVSTMELTAAGQGPAGSFVVTVSVTEPAVLSAAEGV